MSDTTFMWRDGKELTLEEVGELAKRNHIWIDAFSLVRPTEELKKEIGALIIQKLLDSDCRSWPGNLNSMKMVALTINCS